jgi:type II secretory ATPase GspE/PulE/Tfp pilus assembly ATPase PilB-like protein
MPNNSELYDNNKLFQAIQALEIVPENDLNTALAQSNEENRPLHDIVLENDLMTDENVGRVVADVINLPYIKLEETNTPQDVLDIIPEIVAKKQRAIAFERTSEEVKVGTSNPKNEEFKALLNKKTGTPVKFYYATERDVDNTLNRYAKDLQKIFDELFKKKGNVAEIVETLIKYAYQNKASDIHIEPEETRSVVRFRIDGVLHDAIELPKEIQNQVVTRVKILSKLRTDEHMSAQDGKMNLKLDQEDLDIRVSVVPIVEGEKCVLRLLSSRARQFSLNELGMNEGDLKKVKEAYERPHGMVLSTGPTGSGKTTTIYGILKIVNRRNVNIATIEDPVEYDIEGINQIQVNNKTNLTFSEGLRSILRQDPDIIFVGEIRDEETAGIATNAAMTGHLVLSTLHTNDAATTLPRLLDMKIEPFLVASTVNVIIAQRLVRKICDKCKISQTVSVEKLKEHVPEHLIDKYFGGRQEATLYKGKGCPVCHESGYRGRVGVFEVLLITETIRDLISQKANSDTIHNKAKEEGMTTMLEDGIDKVTKGVTTLEEVLRVTRE